jgi:hypothetical protein
VTRSVCLEATRREVVSMCAAQNTPIAMIESLPGGGTRVVLHNTHDAGLVAAAYADLVIAGNPVSA